MAIWTIPGGWVEFRAMNGRDERSVEGASVFDTLALIDRLSVSRPGVMIAEGQAAELTSAQRDRAVACIYAQHYGDSVTSSPHCGACGARYDLSFSLRDL